MNKNYLAAVFILLSSISQAEVVESQFKMMEPANLDVGTSFNFRSTKYTNNAGDTRTLAGVEQFFYAKLGLWQNFTLLLDTSYLSLQSRENQVTNTGLRTYERTQSGFSNVNFGGIYKQELDNLDLYYGLTLSVKPEDTKSELSRNSENSNAVSRQNAIIPMLGAAVPLADLFVVGGKLTFTVQQDGKGKITDKTVTPESTVADTYRDGSAVSALVFTELTVPVHPFISYERSWYYSTLVNRENTGDFRIPGGKSETIGLGAVIPLLMVDILPTYTYTKYSPDDSSADSWEASYVSFGARFGF